MSPSPARSPRPGERHGTHTLLHDDQRYCPLPESQIPVVDNYGTGEMDGILADDRLV